MEKLFSVLSSITPLNPSLKDAIVRFVVPLSLPEQHLLLEAPRIADQAYFLEKGFAMSYTYQKGKIHVESFWKEGSIIVSAKSFVEQVPSREFIRLAVQSDVLCLSHRNVINQLKQHPEANHLFHVVVNQYYERCRERIHDLYYLSTMERFEKLLNTFPKIEQYVSQGHIASYLGITPQHLSRMKREHDRS